MAVLHPGWQCIRGKYSEVESSPGVIGSLLICLTDLMSRMAHNRGEDVTKLNIANKINDAHAWTVAIYWNCGAFSAKWAKPDIGDVVLAPPWHGEHFYCTTQHRCFLHWWGDHFTRTGLSSGEAWRESPAVLWQVELFQLNEQKRASLCIHIGTRECVSVLWQWFLSTCCHVCMHVFCAVDLVHQSIF